MMTSVRPSLSRSAALAALVLLGVGASAHAQNVFDDFSSGNDNAWTRSDATGNFAGVPATFSVTNGAYRLQQPAYNPAFGTVPIGSFRADSFAASSQLSVDVPDWNDATNNVIALSARLSQPTASTFQFYMLSFFPTSGAGTPANPASNLRIDRWNPDFSVTNITAFSSNAFPRVSNTDVYRMVFTLEGTSLLGQLYNISGASPVLITSVQAIDSGPSSLSIGVGGIGLYANGTAGPADATFDNFRVVPAPGAAAMLGLAGLFAARRRR